MPDRELTIARARFVQPEELNDQCLAAVRRMSRGNFISECLSHLMTLVCLFLGLQFGNVLMIAATVANLAFTAWLHRYHDYEEARYILRAAAFCRGDMFA